MQATIELYFFNYGFLTEGKVKEFKLSFQINKQTIASKNVKFNLPDDIFKYNPDKTIIGIQLFAPEESNETEYQSCEYKFHVYNGENKIYIFIGDLLTFTFELIFQKEKNLKLKRNNFLFTELDTLGNKDRCRLTLVNFVASAIIFNEKNFHLIMILNDNYNINPELSYSFQISFQSLNDKKYIVTQLKEKDYSNIKYLYDNKNKLQDFVRELNDLLNKDDLYDEINYINNFQKLKTKYKDILAHKKICLNRSQYCLGTLFKINDVKDLQIFYNVFVVEFFVKNDNISLDKEKLKKFILKTKEVKEQLKTTKIDFYEKIRILSKYFYLLKDINPNEINSLNIRYFLVSEKKDNSVIDKVCKFFDDFINKLSENSKIFPFLLKIDSGYGYHLKKKVYTFDLININMMKNHLKELFPQTLTFYYLVNDKMAFNSSITGGIGINEFYILDEETRKSNIDYNSPINGDNEKYDDIAMKIVLFLLHEYLGHKKFSNATKSSDSPIKIVNENNKLIELKHRDDYIENDLNNEYILTTKSNKGDYGHFLELGYNKHHNELILNILFRLKKIGKLLKNVELFTDDNAETLKEYIIYKTIAEEENIRFNFSNDIGIKEEIKEMKSKIDINKYEKKIKIEEIDNKILNKKTKRNKEKIIKRKKNFGNNLKIYKNKKYKEENKIIRPKEEVDYFKKKDENIEDDSNEEEDSYESYEEESDFNEIEDTKEERKADKVDFNERQNKKENTKINKIEDMEKKEKRIIRKFRFKNDDNLIQQIENKLDERNLSMEDIDDLNFLYSKFDVRY